MTTPTQPHAPASSAPRMAHARTAGGRARLGLALCLLGLAALGCDRRGIDVPAPTDRNAAVPREAAAPGQGAAADEAEGGAGAAGADGATAAKAGAAAGTAGTAAAKRPPRVAADEADEGEPVAVAAAATPGDALGPLPTPARRLGRGATGEAGEPLEPETPCDQLAPDASWKLAQRTTVARLPAKKGGPRPSLELCLFHKWSGRKDEDKNSRAGRQHLFVAAFPGREVAAWTSDELERAPESLPAEAPVSASGWAALLPTGLPDMPALAVASGRFYDGVLGEQVHYLRMARVLRRSRGRWAFTELETIARESLDLAHIDASCAEAAGPEACNAALADAKTWREQAAARAQRRAARLEGKVARSPGKAADGDPQSEWLREARTQLKRKRYEDAALAALRVEAACGEAVVEAREVLAAVADADGGVERAEPRVKTAALCEPIADKGGPPRK